MPEKEKRYILKRNWTQQINNVELLMFHISKPERLQGWCYSIQHVGPVERKIYIFINGDSYGSPNILLLILNRITNKRKQHI